MVTKEYMQTTVDEWRAEAIVVRDVPVCLRNGVQQARGRVQHDAGGDLHA